MVKTTGKKKWLAKLLANEWAIRLLLSYLKNLEVVSRKKVVKIIKK